MARGAAIDLVRRIRLTPIEDLAKEPQLADLASTVERLHMACASELATLERESARNRPNSWSDLAMFGGALATVVGLIDAIAAATDRAPWLGLILGIVGVASAAVGIGDKRRERAANANRAFEIKTLRRDLEQCEQFASAHRQRIGAESRRATINRTLTQTVGAESEPAHSLRAAACLGCLKVPNSERSRGGGDPAMSPDADELASFTDKYFLKTKEVVRHFGDAQATYAVFMRRPVICTPRLAIDWLQAMAAARETRFAVELCYAEGDWVGAGEPLMYITGPLEHLVDLETVFLQKLGPPCVAAFNAFLMCTDLPYVGFLAMDARHCAGAEMAEMMAYAASVGSAKAQREANARGFIGNATDATAHYFGNPRGLGTMPHALIGYAGSTLRAAEMFHATFPDDPLYVLVDYFGREITETLGSAALFRRSPPPAGSASASTPTAGASSRAWTPPSPTRCSTATGRTRSGPTGPRPSCAGWSAPASPRPRSTTCARPWTRPASTRSRSSRTRASARANAS